MELYLPVDGLYNRGRSGFNLMVNVHCFKDIFAEFRL